METKSSPTPIPECRFSLPFHHEFLLTKDCRITTSTEYRDINLPELIENVQSIVEKRLNSPCNNYTRDFIYQTVSIEPCVNEKFAKEFRDRYTDGSCLRYGTNTETKNGRECRYMSPTIVYHGARSQRIIDSIAKRGFLHQGDHIEGTPLSVPEYPVLYGDGIYCSKDLDVARPYSNGSVIVGLCYQGCQVAIDDAQMRSLSQQFDEDVDSRFIPRSDILVVKDSKQILPLFVIREERVAKAFQEYCADMTNRQGGKESDAFGNEIYFRQLTHGYWEINLNSFLKQKLNSEKSVKAEIDYLSSENDLTANNPNFYGSTEEPKNNVQTSGSKKTLFSELDSYFGSSRASSGELRRFDTRRVHKRLILLIDTEGVKNLSSLSHGFSTLVQQCKNVDELAVVEIDRVCIDLSGKSASDSMEWITAPFKKNPLQFGKSSPRSFYSCLDLIYSEINTRKYELSQKFCDFVERVVFEKEGKDSEQKEKHLSRQNIDRLLELYQSRLKFEVVCFSKFDLAPETWTRTGNDRSGCGAAWLNKFNECISRNTSGENYGVYFKPIIHSSSDAGDKSKDHIVVRDELAAFLSANLSGADVSHYEKSIFRTYDATTTAKDTNENPFAVLLQEVVEELNKYDTSCFQNMVLPVEFEGHGRGFVNDLLSPPVRYATDCFLYYAGVGEGCQCPPSVRLTLASPSVKKECNPQGCNDRLIQLRCFQCQDALKSTRRGYVGFVPPYIFINGERIGVRISTSRFDFSEQDTPSSSAFQKLRKLRQKQEKSLRRSLGGLIRKKQTEVAVDEDQNRAQHASVVEKVSDEVLLRDAIGTFEEVVNFFSDFSAGNDFVSHLARLGGALKIAVVAHRNDDTTRILKPRKQLANVDSGRLLLKDWCKRVQRSDVLMKNPQLVAEFMQLLKVVEDAKTTIQLGVQRVFYSKSHHSFSLDMSSNSGGTCAEDKLSAAANELVERAAQSLSLCPSRSSFLKERGVMVNALQECLNEIQKAYLVRTLPVEEWQTSLREMKYATQAVQRAKADVQLHDEAEKESDPRVKSYFMWPDRMDIEMIEKIVKGHKDEDEESLTSTTDDTVSEVDHLPPNSNYPTWAYSGISKILDLEHFAQLVECGVKNSPLDLSSHGMVGLMVDVFRHDASNVDPWKLLVRNVGFNSYEDTAMAYCHAKFKAPLMDLKGESMSDVVVVLPPPRDEYENGGEFAPNLTSEIHDHIQTTPELESRLRLHVKRAFIKSAFYRSYLALVFTRNPWLEVPGQTLAITCITWVKLAEKLMLLGDEIVLSTQRMPNNSVIEKSEKPDKISIDLTFSEQFSIFHDQYLAVGRTIQELLQSKHNEELVCSIRQNCLSNDPVKLTEKFGVSSLCLGLVAMIFGGEANSVVNWDDSKFMRTLFLLLAESIARAAKIYLKFEYEAAINRKDSNVTQVADVSRILVQRVTGFHTEVNEAAITTKSQGERKRKGRSKPFLLQHYQVAHSDGMDDGSKPLCLLKVDRSKALSESSRFFQYVAPNHPKQTKNLFTNCSPHALAATFLLQSLTKEDIRLKADSLEHKKSWLSMSSFFQRLVKQHDGEIPANSPQKIEDKMKEDLQISLYLQGITYFASHLRGNVAFTDDCAGDWKTDPEKIWSKILRAEESLQRYTLEKQQANANRVEARVKQQLRAQEDFLKVAHRAMPKMFTHTEIKAINHTRPENDQLELDPRNGLLRNHCASPSCPLFLIDLRTEKDRRLGTNQGLWNHLQSPHVPEHHRYPISSFHRILIGHLPEKYDRLSKGQYVNVMMERYKNFYGPHRMGKDYQIEFLRKKVEEIWDQSFGR